MSLRRRDVEQWMSHRRLPEELRRYLSFMFLYVHACMKDVLVFSVLENVKWRHMSALVYVKSKFTSSNGLGVHVTLHMVDNTANYAHMHLSTYLFWKDFFSLFIIFFSIAKFFSSFFFIRFKFKTKIQPHKVKICCNDQPFTTYCLPLLENILH